MRKIDFLNLKIGSTEFILIDNETPELMDMLSDKKGYKRLGTIKEMDSSVIIDLLETKYIDALNVDAYKNYYIIDEDEIYGKPWLMLYKNSFASLLLSRKIAIEHLITPNFLEEIEDDMEISMRYPTFYIKQKTP